MPVLARTLEAAGLATVLVTNMPFWAEKIGAPRTLAVEFPFGHLLGQPHNIPQQMGIIRQALGVLEASESPGTIVHAEDTWPVPLKAALKDWQPDEPSPVVEILAPQLIEMMRQKRKQRS